MNRLLTRTAAVVAGVLLVSLLAGGTAHAGEGHDEVIALSWDGRGGHSATTGSFMGTPVAVPGDTATRTLMVRNDGPTAGTLRASIVNVELGEPGAVDTHHQPGHRDPDGPGGSYTGAGDQGRFYDDLTLRWDTGTASFTELGAQPQTPITEVVLEQGETAPISLTYEFPHEATSGNGANVAARAASFDVLLTLGGDLPSVTPQIPSGEPVPGGPDLTLVIGGGLAMLLALAAAARAVTRRAREERE